MQYTATLLFDKFSPFYGSVILIIRNLIIIIDNNNNNSDKSINITPQGDSFYKIIILFYFITFGYLTIKKFIFKIFRGSIANEQPGNILDMIHLGLGFFLLHEFLK